MTSLAASRASTMAADLKFVNNINAMMASCDNFAGPIAPNAKNFRIRCLRRRARNRMPFE
ncbi:hypothetical protein [Bradyrhizobium sp. LMG 9283]|uniref:hypothetical protein n=1 Tax=Bradyrhizobium sp. LMG 9283 TaxID=592064 RepID=UPI00388D9130